MGLWRTGRGFVEKPKFKSGGVVPDARLARSAATGDVVPDEFSPYTQQLVSKKTVLAQMGIEPNFDLNEDGSVMECVWCGSYPHKPDCKALSRNYGTSLDTQREMTQRLRAEMDQVERSAYYQGSGGSGTVGATSLSGPSYRAAMKPEPPKDTRTDLQKRFDAIAEELDESK